MTAKCQPEWRTGVASDDEAGPALDTDKAARIMELMHAAIAKGVAPNEAAEMAMQQAEQES